MKRALFVVIAVLTAGLGLGMQQGGLDPQSPAKIEVGPRFKAVDVFVDSAQVPLAAYQVEIVAKAGGNPETPGTSAFTVTLVGVEGGEHAAFKNPPHYDPAALHADQLKDRIILAAFNTGADLPSGRTRVARIQVMVEGPEPVYSVIVKAAGAADGTRINATGTAVAAGDVR